MMGSRRTIIQPTTGGALPSLSSSKQPAFFFRSLLLAAVGQLFLSQGTEPWTLVPGLLLYGMALWLFPWDQGEEKKTKPLPLRLELTLFFLILALGFGFRLYRIQDLPAGMHTDQGLTGLCALRILHEGWRPFSEVFNYEVPELILFYQLAGWFGLVGSSYFTFHLFFVLLSLAAFPFIYWIFRQWAGQRTALVSLFILAVMRWNWIDTRNGYPSIQVPFYSFGALAFWYYGLRNAKRWAFYVSALWIGVGFYTYQAFKIVPLLMLIYAADEYLHLKKKSFKPFLIYFFLILAMVLPRITAQNGGLGPREAQAFIGSKMMEEKSLKPLWDVWTGTLLMFNRIGDPNPRHNIPGHRMLDDATGVLFVLGLALAWKRRKEPGFFYPLVGFGVMLLTGLLSSDPAASNRLVSLTPFVAYFAGGASLFLWDKARTFIKNPLVPALLAALWLAAIPLQNAITYFGVQANDSRCQDAFGLEQTLIGKIIELQRKNWPDSENFFIDPAYFRNNTVAFLSYPARARTFEFNPQNWAKASIPKEMGASVYLEKGKPGEIDFLNDLSTRTGSLKPGFVTRKDSQGNVLFYRKAFSEAEVRDLQPWQRGLRGVYVNSADWKAKPVTIQWDPVLNFTSKFDFPFTNYPPFRIRWTGNLEISKPGVYQFQVLTTDQAQLWLDGKQVQLEKSLRMQAGAHQLRLDFEKDSGDNLALNFIWKPPVSDKWEVVPATAFGKIPPK